MHSSSIRRGLCAALFVLAAALPARALVVQNFTATTFIGGNYTPIAVPAGAQWTAAGSATPLTAVRYDFTISGSVTLYESNPFQFGMGWTPTIYVGLGLTGPGLPSFTLLNPPVQFTVSGAPQFLPGTPTGPGQSFTPTTLNFSMNLATTITGAALAGYQGGNVLIGDGVYINPLVQYGRFSGTVTHSGTLTYITPDSGATLALLAVGVGCCAFFHRRRSSAGGSRVGL